MKDAIYIPAYSDGLMSMFYSMTDKEIANKYQPDFKQQKSLRIYNRKYDAYFYNPYKKDPQLHTQHCKTSKPERCIKIFFS